MVHRPFWRHVRAIGFLAFLVLALLWPRSAWAGEQESPAVQRPRLTPELFQARLRSPVLVEGIPTLDLRRLEIDLSSDPEFQAQFYRELQTQLQRPGSPLGLDLSDSVIQGDLLGSQLGLRVPLDSEALTPLLSPAAQEQLQRDRRRLFQLSRLSRSLLSSDLRPNDLQLTLIRGPLRLVQTRFGGRVDFSNTFFLGRIEGQQAEFGQRADWTGSRFSQPVSFAGARFAQAVEFGHSIFFARTSFSQARFLQPAGFQGVAFREDANFSRSQFQQSAQFQRSQWQGNADFAQAHWQDQAGFNQARFNRALFLPEATFEQVASFRGAEFLLSVNLRGARILDQVDFSDAQFAPAANLNLPELEFDPRSASFLGDPGQISRVLSVPSLQGNEVLLRHLIRNFRQLEQIADANQIDYLSQKLRSRELWQQLLSLNVNLAPVPRLVRAGFSATQAAAIVQGRQAQPFRTLTELMNRNLIDLETYVRVRERAIAGPPLTVWGRLQAALRGVGLSLLLLLSRYGSSFWLIFGAGLLGMASFSLLFWGVDRWRRRRPQAILPNLPETLATLTSGAILGLGGLGAIWRNSETPGLTLICIACLVLPLPLLVTGLIYQRGRYHDRLEESYFVEDGSRRQLRLLVGRLPIMPRFPLFRDRYQPLLWDRRWNWLNYFDLSLNNLLKFGFNDIRLRDQHVPGLISLLVWYQWGLGLLYIALLLWTLSRTIPGLNLFIYF